MQQRRLNELRRQLLVDGYSPAYVSRLCDELCDHYESMVEHQECVGGGDVSDTSSSECENAVGSVNEIRDAVIERPELQPWIDRFSIVIFVLVPGMLVCLSAWWLIWLGHWVVTSETEFAGRDQLIRWLPRGNTFVVIAMSIVFSVLAFRTHRRWFFLLTACAIISMLGMQNIDLVACEQSNSIYYRSWWGISWLNFSVPWLIAGLTLAIGHAVTIKGSNRKTAKVKKYLNFSQLFACVRPGRFVFCSLVVVIAFVVLVTNAQQTNQIHAVDRMVATYDQPVKIQSVQLQLVSDQRIRRALGIDESKDETIDTILTRYETESREIATAWRAADPARKYRFMGLEHFAEPIADALSQVVGLLSDQQRWELVQLAYQRLGTKILFMSHIQERIQISEFQLTKLKDAKEQVDVCWREIISRAKKLSLEQLESELSKAKANYECRLISILSDKQIDKLSQLMGHDIRSTSSFHSDLTRPPLVYRSTKK